MFKTWNGRKKNSIKGEMSMRDKAVSKGQLLKLLQVTV